MQIWKKVILNSGTQQDAIDIATQALEKFSIEKDIAAYIKKEFDKKYNPTWHCIVGSFIQEETLAPISLMKLNISFTFTLVKLPYYSSSQAKAN